MDRRNFLKTIGKICAVLPFVGSTGDSGVSEGQRRSGTRLATEKEINEYQWHKHNDCEWHCKHRNLPMEFVTCDEYDLFTGKKI